MKKEADGIIQHAFARMGHALCLVGNQCLCQLDKEILCPLHLTLVNFDACLYIFGLYILEKKNYFSFFIFHFSCVCCDIQKKLFYAWLRITELRNIVAAKRILIQRRKQKLKVLWILGPQVHVLNQWESVAKKNAEAVGALSRVLGAACLSLPLVEGAKVRFPFI